MKKLWKNVRQTIAEALRNTPVEAAIAVMLAAVLSSEIAWDSFDEATADIFLTSFLALCAIFATSASHALKVFDTKTRWALTGVFGAGLSAYGYAIFDLEIITEVWRWSFLAIAGVMAVMLVPVAARIGDVSASERFWRYNIRLFGRVSVAYAYALLLYAGLSLGILAIDGLFELSIDDEIFGHLFAWVVVGIGTLLAVGSLGEIKRIGKGFAPETLVWSGRLGTFLFMPLVLLYLGIMYVYLGKVLVTGELPSNILSPLALGAGMLGYFGLFVLQPHMHREDFKPLAAVLRAFPAAFIPIVPFGVYAVWERIAQYGWTEFRYARMAALVCLGVFSVIGAYKWLRKQEFSLVTGPAILGVVACLGAVGPWSASNVSETSQVNRFETELREAGLLQQNGRIVSPETIETRGTTPNAQTIRESAGYLLRTHGDASIAHLTNIDLSAHETMWHKVDAMGFEALRTAPTTLSIYTNSETPLHFDRGGATTNFSVGGYNGGAVRGIEFELQKRDVVVKFDDVEGRATLAFDDIELPFTERSQQLDDGERMVPIYDGDREVGMIGLHDVTVEDRDGEVVPTYVSGIAIIY